MRESQYQAKVIQKLKVMFPGCLVLKNDPQYLQGVPDVLILYYGTWGALEIKLALNGEIQPNQRHYVELMDQMSFAAFICPENEEMVLHELQRALEFGRQARVP
jgi:hypothetical protein